jgi:glycosyltransferase involved in cell wall biosynthesis
MKNSRRGISVVIPCYNDSSGIAKMRERLMKVFSQQLPQYDYEIIYVDDCSPDEGKTWSEIKRICEEDPTHIRGVHNMTNFGWARNCLSSLRLGRYDATFMLMGDLQDPPEYLPEFVKWWEDGYKVVLGQRSSSYSSPLVKFARNLYYQMIAKMSGNKQLEGVTGYGLYDKSFIDILHSIDDIQPVITGIISEFDKRAKVIPVKQEEGTRGKSNFNFWRKYDYAMMSITATTKSLLRIVVFLGSVISILSLTFAIVALLLKLIWWDKYPIGIPSLVIGMFFLGGLQLFFLGIIGEYILSINNRSMKRPLVVIDEKLNFEEDAHKL